MTAKKSAAKRAAPKKNAAKAAPPAPADAEPVETQTDLLTGATPPKAGVSPTPEPAQSAPPADSEGPVQSGEEGEGTPPPAEPPADPQDNEKAGSNEPPEDGTDPDVEVEVPAVPATALGRGLYRNTQTGEQRRIPVRKALALIEAGEPLERV